MSICEGGGDTENLEHAVLAVMSIKRNALLPSTTAPPPQKVNDTTSKSNNVQE